MADAKLSLMLDAAGIELPYSLEAEQAVLGAILVDSSILDDISAILRPEQFYQKQNGDIFREMLLLQSAGKPVDYVTVLDATINAGVFATPDEGKVYLYNLSQTPPAVSNATSYAQIVADRAVNRMLLNACKDIMSNSSEAGLSSNELLDFAEQRIYDIRGGKNTEMKLIKDVSYNVLMDLEKLMGDDREQYLGIPTGFSYLDQITTGLNRSDLIILAARPSVGKTSFALNLATNVMKARPDAAIAIFSLEMSNEQLTQRIISQLASVRSQKFRTGDFSNDEMDRISEATSELVNAQLFLDDSSVTPQEIRAKCRRIKNLGLVIVDYLQLMGGKRDNRVNEISDITRNFKLMAKELDVPIVLLSQLSRGTEKDKRRPMLSDLRDSGSIEQDADIVMFLHRESTEEEREAPLQEILLMVAKNRHGEVRNMHLNFEGDITRFTSIEYNRDEE